MAAQENHLEVVKFLLENGANQSLPTEVCVYISIICSIYHKLHETSEKLGFMLKFTPPTFLPSFPFISHSCPFLLLYHILNHCSIPPWTLYLLSFISLYLFNSLSSLSGWLHSSSSGPPAGPWKRCGTAHQLWHQRQGPPSCTAHCCTKRWHAHRRSAFTEWPKRWCSQQGIHSLRLCVMV